MKGLIRIITSVSVLLVFLSTAVWGKDVAVFTVLKGEVTVTDSGGKAVPATIKHKLFPGDVIKTGVNSSAQILYYSGEETAVSAEKEYEVAAEGAADGFWENLRLTVSNFLWGSERSGTMAGATRSSESTGSAVQQTIYPQNTKVLNDRPQFRWKNDGARGVVRMIVIESDIHNESHTIDISASDYAIYPDDLPALSADIPYRWELQDSSGKALSQPARFVVIHPDDHTSLKKELQVVEKQSGEDEARQLLLSAALYWEYRLMKPAEENLKKLAALRPDWVQPRRLLAQVYRHTNRPAAAQAEEIAVEDLLRKAN